MNKEKTKKAILEDLYSSDPGLKKHEEILLKNIDEMLKARPKLEIDDSFKEDLRKIILEKIEHGTLDSDEVVMPSLWNFMSPMKKMAVSGSFLAIIVLVAGMIYAENFYGRVNSDKLLTNKKYITNDELGNTNILQKGEEAFGELKNETLAQTPNTEKKIANEETIPSLDSNKSFATEDSLARSAIFPAQQFSFKYKGNPVLINQQKSEVLKRVRTESFVPFENLISSFKTELINLDSFSDIKLQSFNFAENKPFGLFVNVNSEEGSVSINQNWEMWQCEKINCPQREMLTIEDVPSDKILLSIADDFIEKHNINMSSFEKGIVDNSWKNQLETSSSLPFVPTIISITYPLKIQEREIYNTTGEREGMTVQVDIVHLHISGLYGLTTQKYESSLYETENDFNKIIQSAENGGSLVSPITLEKDQQTENITLFLDTPSFASAKYWHYENGKNNELIVPVLIFPIVNAKEAGYFQNNIVVPLIKDLLQ